MTTPRQLPLALLLMAALPAQHARTQPPPVDPLAKWRVVKSVVALKRHGWDAARLRALHTWVDQESNATGIVVAHDGYVIFEHGDPAVVTYVASVRKSILAVLYGTHVERRTIRLDDSLGDLGVDDRQQLLPTERKATVLDLITARSGIYHPAANPGDDTRHAPERGSVEPGSFMLYNNWDFNAAGTVFEQCVRASVFDEVDRQLAVPLRFEDWNRKRHRRTGNAKVSKHLAYHMHLSTRDMARVGQLMLRRGRWHGRQLVPAEWIDQITTAVTPRSEMNPSSRRRGRFGYGCMWWVWDGPSATGDFAGAYTAEGYFGQWITVLPAAKLVIAHKTKVVDGKPTSGSVYFEFVDRLLAAMAR